MNRTDHRGFTLLEMLVSIAIVAIVSIILSQVFISTLRTNTKTELLKDIKQNGELTFETMVRAVQNADDVICSDSKTLVVTDTSGNTTFTCGLNGSITRIVMQTASGTSYLTTDNATLGGGSCGASSLSFVCTGGTGEPVTVNMSFVLGQAGTGAQKFEEFSESFETSATMRNTPRR